MSKPLLEALVKKCLPLPSPTPPGLLFELIAKAGPIKVSGLPNWPRAPSPGPG